MARGRGFRVDVDTTEINKELAKISLYSAHCGLKLENAVKSSTQNIAKGGKRRAPKKSGALRKSIKSSFSKTKCEGVAYAKAPHAHLIEFGVKASMTKPKNKKVLKINGKFVGKSVNIPARQGTPFLKPAFEEEKPHLLREIKNSVNRV